MSISLKVQYADEIAEAMAEVLGENFVKNAAGPALDSYKTDLAGVNDEQSLKMTWNKHVDGLNQEESTDEALQVQAAKARELGLPGYASPADDQAAEDVCELCGKKIEEDKDESLPLPIPGDEEEPMAWDGDTFVAADFAISHLVKVADALDGKGFKEVADMVDEAIQKLSVKKKQNIEHGKEK